MILQDSTIDRIGTGTKWVESNRLTLNPTKRSCTLYRLYHLDGFIFILSNGTLLTSTSVSNLGAFFDHALTVKTCYGSTVSLPGTSD